MEYEARRNRRGRDRRSRQFIAPPNFVIPNSQKSWSLFDVLSSFFILSSLVAVMYLMLEYHCSICNTKCDDITNITKNIDDIANNISVIKGYYNDLEMKVIKFSHELPKIEGQIELLETMAISMDSGDFKTITKYNHENNSNLKLHKVSVEHGADWRNVTKKSLNKSIKQED